jgi:hypothetical protein
MNKTARLIRVCSGGKRALENRTYLEDESDSARKQGCQNLENWTHPMEAVKSASTSPVPAETPFLVEPITATDQRFPGVIALWGPHGRKVKALCGNAEESVRGEPQAHDEGEVEHPALCVVETRSVLP